MLFEYGKDFQLGPVILGGSVGYIMGSPDISAKVAGNDVKSDDVNSGVATIEGIPQFGFYVGLHSNQTVSFITFKGLELSRPFCLFGNFIPRNYNKRMNCHCHSGKPFMACCQPYLQNLKQPKTAEALMRSRYTAFCLNNTHYLNRTTTTPFMTI